MALPLVVKSFSSPVPGLALDVVVTDTRGNDNILQRAVNALIVALGGAAAGGGAINGTYTPVLTNVTNVAASTAYACQWLRVGNTVTVSGKVSIDPTAAGATELGMALPVTSALAAAEHAGGVAACGDVAGLSVAIAGDAANDRAAFRWIAVDVANRDFFFTFTYLVI